jgi:hypothetical protein
MRAYGRSSARPGIATERKPPGNPARRSSQGAATQPVTSRRMDRELPPRRVLDRAGGFGGHLGWPGFVTIQRRSTMVVVGDRVLVESEKVGSVTRSGVVTAVEDRLISVRWDSGRSRSSSQAPGLSRSPATSRPLGRPTAPELAGWGRWAPRRGRPRRLAAFRPRRELPVAARPEAGWSPRQRVPRRGGATSRPEQRIDQRRQDGERVLHGLATGLGAPCACR